MAITTRTTSILVFVAVLPFIAGGCNGPTKSGIEARNQARERLDAVHANFSYDQAEQAFKVGQFEEAMAHITATIERYPKVPSYHVLKGRIHLEMGQLGQAVRAFEQAIELNPDHPDAHYFAAIVYQRWSEHDRALTMYQTASELEPENAQYLLAAAEMLVALNQLDEAWDLLADRIEFFEHNAAMRQLQGQIAALQGRLDDALEYYSQARLLNPESLSLVEELAWMQFNAGRYARCLESLEYLAQARGKNQRSDLDLLKARCLTYMGRLTDARDLYVRLTQQDPSNEELWIELGKVAWQMGDYMRVAQCGNRTVALAPDRFEGFLLKAVNERHHGNMKEAIRLFKQAADRSTTSALPHILLGHALEEAERFDDAIAAYSNAAMVDPQSREAVALLSRLESQQQVTSVEDDQLQR